MQLTPVLWAPYCGAAPHPAEWLERWNFDPLLLTIMALATGIGVAKLRHQSRSLHLFGATMLVLAVLFVSPFCALTSALFAARTFHHVLLVAIVAPLLAWSLLPHRHSALAHPAAWTVAHAAIFWAWHAPLLYGAALSNDAIYWAMQLSLLGSAIGFWGAIRHSAVTTAIAALLATMVQMGLLGAILTFSAAPFYAPHFVSTIPWGYSPLEDQQLAGLIMWAPAAGLYLAAALALAARWLQLEGQPAAR